VLKVKARVLIRLRIIAVDFYTYCISCLFLYIVFDNVKVNLAANTYKFKIARDVRYETDRMKSSLK
jgi:hypothetical protein